MSVGDEVVEAAKPFLGIAAKDVVAQAAKGLVGADLTTLDADQLPSLAYWVRIAVLRRNLLNEGDAQALIEAILGVKGQSPRRESMRSA